MTRGWLDVSNGIVERSGGEGDHCGSVLLIVGVCSLFSTPLSLGASASNFSPPPQPTALTISIEPYPVVIASQWRRCCVHWPAPFWLPLAST